MTLESFSIFETGLFANIRASRLNDRGFYAAYDSDNELYIAAADCSFYRLGTFIRDFGFVNFTDYASNKTQSGFIRAMVNGQKFIADTNKPPNKSKWSGELIIFGGVQNGRLDPDAKIKWYFGKAEGRSEKAILGGSGYPSTSSPPFQSALASLLPLIVNSCPYTSEQNGPVVVNGAIVECYSLTVQGMDLIPQKKYLPSWIKGKTIYGVHRSANIIFFLVQPQTSLDGIYLRTVIQQLAANGVEDAFLGDGATSSFLAVDGNVEAWSQKADYKELTIPSGFQLELSSLEVFSGSSTFSEVNDPDLALKIGSLPAEFLGVQVKLEWTTNGPAMTITHLGGTLTGFDLKMGAQPLILPSDPDSGNDLVQGVTFQLQNGEFTMTVNCSLIVQDPADKGRISGYFNVIQNPSSAALVVCDGTINWSLA
jgi:hypothetical protein